MFEIFVVPYMVISGVIGFAVFEPFFRFDNFETLSLSKLTIGDLLAIIFPIGVLFAIARWTIPEDVGSISIQLMVVAVVLLFAMIALVAGLFLIPDDRPLDLPKRMAIVGVVTPFGILLTLGWIGLLAWAGVYSTVYLVPCVLAIAVATSVLRVLAMWSCRNSPAVGGSI